MSNKSLISWAVSNDYFYSFSLALDKVWQVTKQASIRSKCQLLLDEDAQLQIKLKLEHIVILYTVSVKPIYVPKTNIPMYQWN